MGASRHPIYSNDLHFLNPQVAWVQVDTQTILTIHKQVITRNPRISLLHDDHKSWHLKIENVQEKDRGFYMCQVNTDPMRYRQGYLDVVGEYNYPYRKQISLSSNVPMVNGVRGRVQNLTSVSKTIQ